jgi:hypothetical protein
MESLLHRIKEYFKEKALYEMPKWSVCAEIGVWKGDFSEKILEVVKPKKLHLIDPWLFMPKYRNRWYGGLVAKNQKDMTSIYHDVRRRFKKNKNVIIHRATSQDASSLFKNDYFDWIFLDGNHSYEYVKKDIELYLSKIKKGGFIAGDDYWWRIREGFPVKRAVDEMVRRKKLTKVKALSGTFLLQK